MVSGWVAGMAPWFGGLSHRNAQDHCAPHYGSSLKMVDVTHVRKM